MKFNINNEQKEIIKNLYLKEGLSCTKIAKQFKTTAATISSFLKRNGIEVINKQNFLNYNISKDILPRYQQGESLSKLAKEFNTSVQTLSRNLKKLGIEIVNRQNETKFDETIFDNIDSEEKAYWLGFIFADGYISSSSYDFELSLKGSDIEHLHKFNKFMKHNKDNIKLGTTKLGNKTYLRCRWGITNKHLWQVLNSYGCTPRKSLTLKFPKQIAFNSNKIKLAFIRGYFDGDGCISYHTKEKNIKPKASILGTQNFLKSIQECISSITENSIYSSVIADKRMLETFVLNISQPDTLKFLDYLYEQASIYLDRKYKRYKIFKNCRSKQECLELLASENGEDCDVNPVISEDSNKSSTL